MKVYVVLEKDGLEICGIDKAFPSREKAEHYLINQCSNAESVKQTYGTTLDELWTKEELDDFIVEVEVEIE